MKRSDLDTGTVLATVRDHRFQAYEYLCTSHPPKIVFAAIERDVDQGLLEYGVALHRPWLTESGQQYLADY